jgi:hypothetical protein
MPGGTEAPKYQNYRPQQLEGGQTMLPALMNQYLRPAGISQESRDIQEKQGIGKLTGNLRTSQNQLGNSLSAAGNIPLSERIKGFTGLQENHQSGVNDVYSNISQQNEMAKMGNKAQGLSGYMNLLGLANNKEGAVNQYGMDKFRIDKENEFNLGKFAGGLAGLGSEFVPKPRAK